MEKTIRIKTEELTNEELLTLNFKSKLPNRMIPDNFDCNLLTKVEMLKLRLGDNIVPKRFLEVV